jgi:glycosyl transferase family WbsX
MDKTRAARRVLLCIIAIGITVAIFDVGLAEVNGSTKQMDQKTIAKNIPDYDPYTVACYYFPNYHPDPHNEELHGPGWSEWELLKNAGPRFKGHDQPKEPLWGYTDESDPIVMAKKIDAAANHGIDVFIFDWYWYNNEPFLQRGLEEGFLGAGNNIRMKFSLMWANHDMPDVFPSRLANRTPTIYPGEVTRKKFDDAIDYIIKKYFKHPTYWLIDGCPYFSIYDLDRLIKGLGGKEPTRAALVDLRAKTKAAGFKDLHLNAIVWNETTLPGEDAASDMNQLIKDLGFDSFTSYVWIHHVALKDFPETDYNYVRDRYLEYWDKAEKKFDLPYFPNVSMGWDSTPRTLQSDRYINAGYPFIPTISDNTPQRFQEALKITKKRMDKQNHNLKIMNINAWNEWTEGSYLEPDMVNGMAYLEAIKKVFGDQ